MLRFAALVSWLVTASLGAFMLRTWLARGGLSTERAAAGGLPPQLIFGHAAAAVTGLLGWAAFLATGARPLAWTALGLLTVVVGLGLCTVTLWTPYPARKPGERRTSGGKGSQGTPVRHAAPAAAGPDGDPDSGPAANPVGVTEVTDEMIARFLADPGSVASRPHLIRPNPAVLVPVAHGFGAIATLMFALLSAIT